MSQPVSACGTRMLYLHAMLVCLKYDFIVAQIEVTCIDHYQLELQDIAHVIFDNPIICIS